MIEDELRVCMHGIKEDFESHSCTQCQLIARSLGQDMETDTTYFFAELPESLRDKKL
jgi:hypothetical protein